MELSFKSRGYAADLMTIGEVAISATAEPVALCYVTRTGWDPRQEDVPHAYLVATPRTVRAWNSLPELDGRTIMRDGQWTSA